MSKASQFSESLPNWAQRQALGLALRLMPKRLVDSIHLTAGTAMRSIVRGPAIPNQSSLFSRPDGFAGIIHDKSVPALVAGMKQGFYIQSHVGPRKWWSPSERAVMMLSDVHLSRRFKRTLRTTPMTVTIDTAFDAVMDGCGGLREGRPKLTWLYPDTMQLFHDIFEAGHAHSVEVWDENGVLVGGLFGVSVGPVFSALSMFHNANDASKVAIVSLYHHLSAWGFLAVDHQSLSPWVATLGGVSIPRADYVELLTKPAPAQSLPGRWAAEFTAAQTADWEPPKTEHTDVVPPLTETAPSAPQSAASA